MTRRPCGICGSTSYIRCVVSSGIVTSCSDCAQRALRQRHFKEQRAVASGTCGLCGAGIVARVHKVWRDDETDAWFHLDCAKRSWKSATR